jgi:RHH-type proline utilization regulon transcriptional repressor/proline dehydrogenase/delta 1-pyrroline-5-carboxylate dehydrogenase
LQEDAAPRIMTMLKGAMAELSVGNPEFLATDIGPVISREAQQRILDYIETMRTRGHAVYQIPLNAACAGQNFVPPTVIEIGRVEDLGPEIFGPVLHVMTFRAAALDALVDAINATGYGLTFGLHTRIDATVARVVERIHAGNIYVNRNIVGAVVGVQPFGGHGLSGTGPKAGGPLYLRALLAQVPFWDGETKRELPGPVGERNVWEMVPRGRILCVAETAAGRHAQGAAVRAAGGTVVTDPDGPFEAVLLEGDAAAVQKMAQLLAALPGPIIPVYALSCEDIAARLNYPVEFLMLERCISTNTAAAGGNASLMQIG